MMKLINGVNANSFLSIFLCFYNAHAFSTVRSVPARSVSFQNSLVSSYRSTAAQSFSGSSTTLSALAIEAAQEGSWKAYLDDEKTGLIFYYNHQTGESRWEPPSPSFPAVQLNSFLKDRTTEVREAYLNTLKKDRMGLEPLKQFAGNFLNAGKSSSDDVADRSAPAVTNAIETDSKIEAAGKSFGLPSLKKSRAVKVESSAPVASSPSPQKVEISQGPFHIQTLMDGIGQSLKPFQEAAVSNPKPNGSGDGDEPPKKTKPEDKFTFAQKIESTKAGIAGLVAGATVLLPFNVATTLAGDSANKGLQFGLDTAIGGVESALFAIVYRYCVRDGEESNDQLGNGVAGAFAITRALSSVSGDLDQLDLGVLGQFAFSGVESLVLFYAVKAALDLVVEKGFINRMD